LSHDAGSTLPPDSLNFGIQVRDFLFEFWDFAWVIGLFAGGIQQLLEPLNFGFRRIDLLLLFLVQSHLPGIPS
jgi:hypothetical protein